MLAQQNFSPKLNITFVLSTMKARWPHGSGVETLARDTVNTQVYKWVSMSN